MDNSQSKTIEELEKDYWPLPLSFPTELVEKVYLLRKKNLSELKSNDLRILISQNIALKYTVPMAIKKVTHNIMVEALYYPGDLLLALLKSSNDYWVENTDVKSQFISLLKIVRPEIVREIDDEDEIDQNLLKTVDNFISSR